MNDTAEVLHFFEEAWKNNDAAAVVDATLANTDFWDTDLTKVEGLANMVKGKVAQLQQEEKQEKIA
ncbi:hypothetical protein GCM10028895_25380 [Pontibacter rugosus]